MAKTLDEAMEFWVGIEVLDDGTIVEGVDTPSMELYMEKGDDGQWHDQFQIPEGWALMAGYSGQHGYNGPVMHPSEFISGGMERDILGNAGVYVSLVIESDCGYTEEFCYDEVGCECEPAGWAVAYKNS